MTLALVLVIFPICMAYAAFSDLVSMTIENRVSLLLVAGYVCIGVLAGFPIETMAAHAGVGLACLVLTFGMFAAGWMGGGDAKLMAASALWFGPTPDLMAYAVNASLLGGGLTLGLLAARSQILPVTGIDFIDHLLDHETGIPYGIALGAAGLVTFSSGGWMRMALDLAS
ncbi:peptidase [Aureimonas sp. Leaf454]|uniref:A24 family peptidase n=1 Tax=Aureimonas sp. Leaf454 TaxID=1736381 RepID=UPI0006F2A377|nr:prepilin peptidase [Aureimonas sp. Leaf454]KQT44505.1 peptidase [Aureimonas sp. Leaf454]